MRFTWALPWKSLGMELLLRRDSKVSDRVFNDWRWRIVVTGSPSLQHKRCNSPELYWFNAHVEWSLSVVNLRTANNCWPSLRTGDCLWLKRHPRKVNENCWVRKWNTTSKRKLMWRKRHRYSWKMRRFYWWFTLKKKNVNCAQIRGGKSEILYKEIN